MLAWWLMATENPQSTLTRMLGFNALDHHGWGLADPSNQAATMTAAQSPCVMVQSFLVSACFK